MRRADRIVFGTGLSSGQTVEQGRIRAGLVFCWLESDNTFRVPEAADFLLGPPEDGLIQGMSPPDDVLTKIYRGNFRPGWEGDLTCPSVWPFKSPVRLFHHRRERRW